MKGEWFKHSAHCRYFQGDWEGVFREGLFTSQQETDIHTSTLWGTYLVKPHEWHRSKLAIGRAVVGEDSVTVY